MAKRVDFVGRLDGKQRTPQGFVKLDANLTRTGIFIYRDARGGEVREYRPPEEVFKADSLETLKLAPLVVGHPDMITPDNVSALEVGTVGENVRADGIFVKSGILIKAKKALDRVDSGELEELSCGYEVDLEWTSGVTPEGEKYDAVQRNIRYNHVGLGPKNWGRAGNDVRLHLDSAGNVDLSSYSSRMTLEEALKALDAEKKRADSAEAARDALKVENDKNKVRADAAEQELVGAKALTGKLIDPAKLPEMIAARVSLETNARAILGADASFTKKDSNGNDVPMTDDEIVSACLVKHDASFKTDGRSGDYLRARFDTIVEATKKTDAALGEANAITSIPDPAKGAEKSRLDQARENAEKEAERRSIAGPPAGAHVRS